MDDLTNGASNAPAESISTPEAEVSSPPAASTAREALERAFQSVGGTEPKPAGDRTRDEAGRFAPKQAAPAAQPGAPAVPQDGQQQAPAAETPASVGPAPQRFTKAAQEAWAQAPEAIRTEVARMEAELTKGLNDYQQRWEPLKRFDEMARSGGTTLDAALTAYTNMENLIRRDPVAGMVEICRNAGIDPAQMAQALAGQQPSGGGSPEVAALKAEIAALKNEINGVGQTISQRDVTAQVEAFAKDHPHFDDLADTIAQMISTGFAKDLPDAYEKAVRLNPEVAAKIEASKAPPEPPAPKTPDPAQTRKASLSITGSPAGGSNPGSRKPAGSTREALANAFAQVGLS